MYMMVYGEFGRTGMYMFQKYCRLLGIDDDEQQINNLQAVLKRCSSDHTLPQFAAQSTDMQHTTGLADLFLHPCDRPYAVSQIYAWFDRCGLCLCRWCYQAPYHVQCSPLAHTPHASRLLDLSRLIKFPPSIFSEGRSRNTR